MLVLNKRDNQRFETVEMKLVRPVVSVTNEYGYEETFSFFLGATAPIWTLAYLHETLRFTSVF
jgi:hypothetical protein